MLQMMCSPAQSIAQAVSPLRRLFLPVFFLFLLFSFRGSEAQATFGSVIGTITDQTGAVVPNATVTVTDVNKGVSQTVTTNGSGNYQVNRLIPDTYVVKVTTSGFAPAQSAQITVTADEAQQVNLQLRPGSATQIVKVTAAPPPLKTDRADVSQTLSTRQLQSIPNINRNFTQFTLLSPGVQRSSFSIAPTENPQGTVGVEADGSNYGTLGWYLDGADDREPVLGDVVINPTLDSVSQMQVITQNYPAEFGGAVGGFIIAQTKSGSNQFHGDAFDFRRSGEFQARDPFTQYPGVPFPGQLYNQFGGSLGGPIRHDRAFFFLDYQGTRQRIGNTLLESVPTAQVRSTCLSGSGTCDLSQYIPAGTANPYLHNPQTGAYYRNYQIPASDLSPQAISLLSALPPPNTGAPGATTNNYVASGNGNNDADQADLRVDDQATRNLHAFGRYDYANFRLYGVPVFGAAGGSGFGIGNTTGNDNVQNQSAVGGFDWAVHPDLLTDLRFGFLDYHVAENKFDTGTDPATAAGIPNLNTSAPDTSGSPTYNVEDSSISNFGNQGCNCPLLESEQEFQVTNNWTLIHGNHTIRLGADLRYAMNLRNASDNNRSGLLSFGNGSTAPLAGATPDGTAAAGPGLGLASLLLGDVDTFQRYDAYSQTAASRQKRGAFYAQDSWRVTPRFTLNYGARWDIVFPETVNSPANGGFTDLSQGVIRVAGIDGIATNGNAKVDLTDFGGRLGFAWQMIPGTILRGAVAQMYDDEGFFGTIFGSVMTHNLPVLIDEDDSAGNAVGSVEFPITGLPAKPAAPFIPSNGLIPLQNGYSPQIRPDRLILPRVDQYNLSLQQQITDNMTATLAYVGNVAERIYPSETYGFNVNVPVLPTSPSQLADRNARRPYYNRFTAIYDGTTVMCCDQDLVSVVPAARSNYNAMEATLRQRFSHGVQLLANYTWSRALNYSATYFAQNPVVEYGPNDTNRNQLFTLSGLWQLPVGKGRMLLGNVNRFVDELVGGWQLAGDATWESGLPFTPTYAECGSDQDIDSNFGSPGTSSDCRPDKAGGSFKMQPESFDPVTHSVRYFTPVAPLSAYGSVSGPFARPAFGTIGNFGRNALRGPSDFFADASLFKTFPITERLRAQFQFQAFNVFNHVPLGVPSATNARTSL